MARMVHIDGPATVEAATLRTDASNDQQSKQDSRTDSSFISRPRRLSNPSVATERTGPKSRVLTKLIDLGTCVGVREAAKEAEVEAAQSLMTFTDMHFAGTPAYASPENFIDPGSVSFSTDVWSLAATLFHLVSGQLPFDASTPIAASISIAGDLNASAPDVRDAVPEHLRSNISSVFAEVLAKALEKKIEKRIRSVDELSVALHGCLVQRGEEMYSAFISYRVFSEKFHAMMLYEVLNNTVTPSGHRVVVYLDAKRLIKGEDWEEGFSVGLLNSLVALPLISEGVLSPIAELTGAPDDKADNVLKELVIMQTLQGKAGKLETIYPILVGRPCAVGEPTYPGTGNFFKECGPMVPRLVDRRSPATMDAVTKFLSTRNVDYAAPGTGQTVLGAVQGVLARQGTQLSAHSLAGLPEEEISEDSDIVRLLTLEPPSPPMNLMQLRGLKAQIRALVPDIHAVIDRALAAAVSRRRSPSS